MHLSKRWMKLAFGERSFVKGMKMFSWKIDGLRIEMSHLKVPPPLNLRCLTWCRCSSAPLSSRRIISNNNNNTISTVKIMQIFFKNLLFVLFHTKKRKQLLNKYVSIFIQKLSVSQAAKSTQSERHKEARCWCPVCFYQRVLMGIKA